MLLPKKCPQQEIKEGLAHRLDRSNISPVESVVRVLFVCLGNICRSPAAENIFREVVKEAGLSRQIIGDSAGTLGLHTGKKPDSRMSRTLAQRSYPVTGAARGFTREDFSSYDLILTMDCENRRDVLALARSPEEKAKVRDFTDFCQTHSESAVPDPYYGGQEGFEFVADLIEDGARGLLAHLRSAFKV